MTNQEIIDYYADLLILQYKGKDNAYATIQALATMVVMNQLPLSIENAFEIDTAVGVQLDVVGKYAGISRYQNDFTGPVTLTDADFRLLIKIKIIQNNAGSSLSDIQTLLEFFFSGALMVYDYKSMRLSYTFDSGAASTSLAEVFVNAGLLPKPMGVQLSVLISVPDPSILFGFRTYYAPAFNATPFNRYPNGFNVTWEWLSYADGVSP